MTHSVFFDLDGTLARTEVLNVAAYHLAGVIIPESATGRSWKEWLPALVGSHAVDTHEEKQRHYIDLIATARIDTLMLPAAALAHDLLHAGSARRATVMCLTAASGPCARAVLHRLDLRVPVRTELTYQLRLQVLQSSTEGALRRGLAAPVYVDDSVDNVTRLRYDLPDLRVVHYTGQTYDQLRSEVDALLGEDDDRATVRT